MMLAMQVEGQTTATGAPKETFGTGKFLFTFVLMCPAII
jgi:hypothetical protein